MDLLSRLTFPNDEKEAPIMPLLSLKTKRVRTFDNVTSK